MNTFVVLAAVLAYANAGFLGAPAVATYSAAPAVSSSYLHQASPVAVAHAPVATYAAPVATYAAHAPVAYHAPAVGASQQSVVRSLGGNQAISTYSKAVDSAFSSVRKYDTRVTNDGLTYAHAPVAVAHAAPVVSTYAHAAPVVSAYSHAPVAYATHGPVAYTAHAPVATYAAHAPVATYAAHAPVATYAAHAPVATYAAHAPVVATKAAAIAYSPAAVVSHATFTGLGTSYAW